MAEKTKLEIRKAISDYRNYINETIVDAIIKPVGNSKESFAEKFIAKYMSAALKDTSSKEAQTLANILIKPDSLEQFQRFEASNRSADIDMMLWKINNTLYDKQQEVFSSFLHNAYKRYIIINSRRTGKTELMGRLIVANLISSNDAHVVYINRNSSAAIRQIKKPLLTALAQTNLQIVKGSVESQFIEFNNGSQLLICGNNNAADIDRTRGERISLCIMDECGHQRNTRQIIREVIEPAMADYGKEAKLVLVGTPPRIPYTYVEDVWNNAISLGWQAYHWTYMDNPHLPDRDSILDDVCKSNGVTPDSAFIQREYFGRMNVYDDDAKFIKKYTIEEPADIKTRLWDYAWIGVDYGVTDKAAVVSVLADSKSREMFVVDDWSEDGKEVTALCKEIMRQYENLKALNVRRSVQVIADTNNKEISLELHRTYKIPNVALAYKHDKDLALDQLAEWFKTGRIKLSDKAKAVRKDADLMVWERDEETDKIVHKLDDDTYHGNAMFATLYVSRQFDACVLGSSISRTAKDIIESTRHKPYKGEYEENYDEYEHCENDNEHWQDAY